MDTVLSMKHICKSFFGVPANDDISLEVASGEIHALLGENGAGKTTLMNILYGLYPHDRGTIAWKGEQVSFRSPKDAIARNIGMVHQHFTLVPKLTVSQNITLGLHEKGYPFTDRKHLDKRLRAISERYGLAIEPSKQVLELSVGQQQRVEIMKLLYRDVELLILDEPTAVLTPGETGEFFRVLRKLKADGKSIIIITHRIPEVMEISDRVTVLRDGKLVCSTDTASLTEDALSRYMIGRQLKHMERKPYRKIEGAGVEIRHLSILEHKRRVLSDVCLDIAPGQIVGIAGVDGNGQKPLAESIVGIRPNDEGSVLLNGQDLAGLDVCARKRLGIGYISDDRHTDGLIIDMSLSENMLLRSTRSRFIRHGFLDRGAIEEATEDAVRRFSIKAHSIQMPIRLLSGGNQQKLILARELHDEASFVIAFQPTRGLDVGASEFIREQLLAYRDRGCCILLISADLEEIFSISDRIAVMHGGRIMGEVTNTGTVDMTEIGLMMAGRLAGRKSLA